MRLHRLSAVPLAVLLLAGCYHYVPTERYAQPRGTAVRASLDSLASFELSAVTVNNIERVDGEMVRLDQGDMVLSASWLHSIIGNGFDGGGWTVRIPESNLMSLQLKKVSLWRTGVVIGGLVLATWVGFDQLGGGTQAGGGGGGTGPIS